jgi:glutamate-5-semialdehyde dehydrogenase
MDRFRVIQGGAGIEPRDLHQTMLAMGQEARRASRHLALASAQAKNTALMVAAGLFRTSAREIIAANQRDVEDARTRGASSAALDRLELNEARIESMAQGVEAIAALPDPTGRVLAVYDRPNGLKIERVSTPLGVIGVIYESRPNVTADAGALCLKAGNAVILRGGSDSFHSSALIHQCLVEGLRSAHLPDTAIARVPFKEREAVGELLKGLGGNVDVIVPRGGKSLVARVQEEARVPVFAHLEGIVHVFVHARADLEKAKKIVFNAKLRRTGICGATETLLIDRDCAHTHLSPLVLMLLEAGCEVRGDETTCAVDRRVKAAIEEDWRTEYLERIISVKVVDGLEHAIDHIENYGSHHTDCIITEDQRAADYFLTHVDSAIVMHNASTQFADGGEFGFGGEIGIATGRMHARGPVGLEQLTSFNYRVHGNGQTRP